MDEYITRNSDIIKKAVAKIPRDKIHDIIHGGTLYLRYLLVYVIFFNKSMGDIGNFMKLFAQFYPEYSNVPTEKIRFYMFGRFWVCGDIYGCLLK